MTDLGRFSRSFVLSLTLVAGTVAPALAQGPVVQAVLFYSPTCPHCHRVINEHLPVIFQRYGGDPIVTFDANRALHDVSNGQLEILLVDVSKMEGYPLYAASTQRYNIPRERQGVPRMIVGDNVLVGSIEIPTLLPRLIDRALAGESIGWPEIDGLPRALTLIPGRPLADSEPDADTLAAAEPAEEDEPVAENRAATETETTPGEPAAVPAEPVAEPTSETEPGPSATDSDASAVAPAAEEIATPDDPSDAAVDSVAPILPASRPSVLELYRRDPVGNSMSVVVLIYMIVSLAALAVISRQPPVPGRFNIAVPVIAVIGIAVAAYLTYVESTGAAAVCGPVGDCNTVQQSEYALLFGVLPVGAVGLAGYVAIIGAWIVTRIDSGPAADWAKIAILVMTVLGTLFSVYLTFLEPFVIGATCAWCLTSAVAITLLMLLSARPALESWVRVRPR